MVGYWSFEETGTTANDFSGYGNHGTMYSSSTPTDLHTTSGCKVGMRCVSFDRFFDQYINMLDVSEVRSNLMTITVWVKPTELNNNRVYSSIYNFGGDGSNPDSGFHQRDSIQILSNGKIRAYLSSYSCTGGGSYVNIGVDSNSVVATGEWVFIAQINDYINPNVKIFINGSYQAQASQSDRSCFSNFNNLWIGRRKTNLNMSGVIDDFRIYNRALSAAEIKAIYEATK